MSDGERQEHPDTVAQIAAETGHPRALVAEVVNTIHDVIDYLLADDYVVALQPMVIAFGDSPTRSALAAAASSAPHEAVAGDHRAIAEWLELDFDTYILHPLANNVTILNAVADLMEVDADERFGHLWDVFEAWESLYEDPQKVYRVSRIGREAHLEDWLVDHLDVLSGHGYDVALAHRQYRLPSKRIPDLIARMIGNDSGHGAGDWLVIELKATRVYPGALHQVHDYVSEVAKHLASGEERVHGLLIADGIDYKDQDLRNALGVEFLSVAALGYRDELIQRRGTRTPMASTLTGTPDVRPTDAGLLDFPASDDLFAGWESYVSALFSEQSVSGSRHAQEVEVATALWAKREERREAYEARWGGFFDWPAQHATTVVRVAGPGPETTTAAVCIRCGWIVGTDAGGDLHAEAKQHALAYPHATLLERGENPPDPERERMQNLFAEARRNPRRSARRAKPRGNDSEQSGADSDSHQESAEASAEAGHGEMEGFAATWEKLVEAGA